MIRGLNPGASRFAQEAFGSSRRVWQARRSSERQPSHRCCKGAFVREDAAKVVTKFPCYTSRADVGVNNTSRRRATGNLLDLWFNARPASDDLARPIFFCGWQLSFSRWTFIRIIVTGEADRDGHTINALPAARRAVDLRLDLLFQPSDKFDVDRNESETPFEISCPIDVYDIPDVCLDRVKCFYCFYRCRGKSFERIDFIFLRDSKVALYFWRLRSLVSFNRIYISVFILAVVYPCYDRTWENIAL